MEEKQTSVTGKKILKRLSTIVLVILVIVAAVVGTKSTSKKDAKSAMDRFKTEVASELGVNLKEGYNGDLTSKEAGSIGGEMVRRMVKNYEESQLR